MTISNVETMVFEYPTDQPEADGTIAWDSTTVVAVRVRDGDHVGLGWTYAAAAAQAVITDFLEPCLLGADAGEIPRIAAEMARACRNVGRPGIAACAISAVDIALWDLRARQLNLALAELFGRRHDSVSVYGSGGFTTYDDTTLTNQLSLWVDEWRIPRVKIKHRRVLGRVHGSRLVARRTRAQGHRRRGAVRRRERRLLREAGHPTRPLHGGVGRRALVRGTSVLGRPPGTATNPRTVSTATSPRVNTATRSTTSPG